MQIRGLHKSIYIAADRAWRQENEEKRRAHPYYPIVERWEKLRESGVKVNLIQEILGISRSTYYRYKKKVLRLSPIQNRRPKRLRQSRISPAVIERIRDLRREDPTYGKQKIHLILKRDHGILLSESSVGRVLSKLKQAGKIPINPSVKRTRRHRVFKGHAKAWKYGQKAEKFGTLVQLDHMSVSKHNYQFKHFQAYDPVTKRVFAELYSNATSRSAKTFLLNLIQDFPFKIDSIQVDGGSEFMADFEAACQELGIELFVLPPRRPQWNGGVERANRTFREDFYARTDLMAEGIGEFREALKKALSKYNGYRPHQALKGMTPNEYTQSLLQAA
jgi:putative transposase